MTDSDKRLALVTSELTQLTVSHVPTNEPTDPETNHPEANRSPNASPAGGLQTLTTLDGKTWVYHCMCSHGAVIYVGVARDVGRRLRQHQADKSWWPDVDIIICDRYDNRAQALAVEKHSIQTGNFTHMHNRQHYPESVPAPYQWDIRRDWHTKPTLGPDDYLVLPYQQGSRMILSTEPEFHEFLAVGGQA